MSYVADLAVASVVSRQVSYAIFQQIFVKNAPHRFYCLEGPHALWLVFRFAAQLQPLPYLLVEVRKKILPRAKKIDQMRLESVTHIVKVIRKTNASKYKNIKFHCLIMLSCTKTKCNNIYVINTLGLYL